MLQQTQVGTVLPYWNRWMRALPDVRALARANPARVLKLWEGLGYYTRARNLHRAAKHLVAERHGRFPGTFAEVLSLPGVGRYTAGAICSIAFNHPMPVLDGNVTRVLARLFAVDADPRQDRTKARLWQWAEALVRQAAAEQTDYRSRRTGRCAGNCSLLNQSLMELGAVICTPRQPRCSVCPVRELCQARRCGRVAELPRAPQRRRPQSRRVAAFVVECAGRVLVRQRPAGALNGQLWEFPNVEVDREGFDAVTAANGCLPKTPMALRPLCLIRHTITSSAITLHAFYGRLATRPKARASGDRWLAHKALKRLAFPSAHRRILEVLCRNDGALTRDNREIGADRSRAVGVGR
jgi:A/G-specific adenine glycosylase